LLCLAISFLDGWILCCIARWDKCTKHSSWATATKFRQHIVDSFCLGIKFPVDHAMLSGLCCGISIYCRCGPLSCGDEIIWYGDISWMLAKFGCRQWVFGEDMEVALSLLYIAALNYIWFLSSGYSVCVCVFFLLLLNGVLLSWESTVNTLCPPS